MWGPNPLLVSFCVLIKGRILETTLNSFIRLVIKCIIFIPFLCIITFRLFTCGKTGCRRLPDMATEETKASNGWPLGLEVMHMRLRVVQTPEVAPAEPYSVHMHLPSFSSFSSSNLDTESTASFFQDHSVSLGWLIGIRPHDRGSYLPSRVHPDEREIVSVKGVSSEASQRRTVDMPQGVCIPLLLGTLDKMNRSRRRSKS